MTNLVQELTQLQQDALAALAQTDSTAATEAWYCLLYTSDAADE